MEGAQNQYQTESRNIVNYYSNYLLHSIPAAHGFLEKLFVVLHIQKRKSGLPLPLPFSLSLDSFSTAPKASKPYDFLEDVTRHIFDNLHDIQKNLEFWQSQAEGSDGEKLYFMVLERGPWAFVDTTFELMSRFVREGRAAAFQQISHLATSYISQRINVLSILRNALATFQAEVFVEVDRLGEDLLKDPEVFCPILLNSIDVLFSNLEATICNLHSSHQTSSSMDGYNSLPVLFDKLSETTQGSSQMSENDVRVAINVVHRNLEKLGSYLSMMVAKHQKPKRITRYWIRYTCGAVGLSVCSFWVLKHSRLMGSPDIDNWVQEAKESTINFFVDHVEQPLRSLRDELFDTFRKRHKCMMEMEEMQLTASSLHRMLLAFSEQTKGQKFPEDASDQEMMEIVMSRYEKELAHPIQNFLNGELARALLIQVQKLKLDIEIAMLELNQILKANEINFAVLAALPAFFLSLLLLMLFRAWIQQDTRAEGRGRIGRRQRRLLLAEVEKKITQYQIYLEQGMETESKCSFGLVLYSLDRLFQAVEKHARASGEWQCLKQDILSLAKPGLHTAYKLTVTSRMERLYECMLPSLKRI